MSLLKDDVFVRRSSKAVSQVKGIVIRVALVTLGRLSENIFLAALLSNAAMLRVLRHAQFAR